VVDHRERLVPPIDEIRERVAAAFREGEADKKAEQRAAELLEKVRSGAGTLSEVGSSLGVSVAREVGITKASGGDGLLRDTEIREELIRSGVEGATLNKATKSGGKWVVAQVSAILEPTAEELEKKLASVRSELKTQEGSLVLSSVLNTIKARAETDIDASILAD
jgi:intein/homing endonuclease